MAEKKKSGVNKLLDMAAEDEIGSLDGMENTFGLHASPTLSLSSDDAEKIADLKMSDVHPNPNQPRQHFNETKLGELAANIRENGLISPILVRPVGKAYEIVAGERRYQASQIAGIKTIKCIVREMEDKEAFKISLTENLLREDLDPFEEAASYVKLQDEFGMTQAQIADTVQKSQQEISSTSRLITLPEAIRSDYSSTSISKTHLKELFALDDPEMQIRVYQEMKKGDFSVKEIRAFIKKIAKKPTTKKQVTMTVLLEKKFSSFFKAIDKDLKKSVEKATADQKAKLKGIINAHIDLLKKTRDKLL